MKADKSKRTSWPPIVTRKRANGQVFEIAVMVSGKRIRERFKTSESAEERAEAIRNSYREEGKAAFTLPPDLRAEAAKCSGLLKPHGVTITDAVQHYMKHVIAYRTAPTVSEIVGKLLADTLASGRRARTVKDLRGRLDRFARTFGDRQLSSITLPELKAWVDDPTLSARSRVNYATKASQLYNFAIRHGWADTNLVERITRPSIEDKAVEVFTVDEVNRLLTHAETFGLLPFVCIGLFAGLRSAELQRLDWSAVKLGERCIIVGSEVAKKRSRRVVEINETLAAWLALCARPAGRVVNVSEDHLGYTLKQLAKTAGVKWKHNGLRHCFGSFHLALHGEATKTAFQMGNSATILHNYYKGLVTNGDVQRYWSLRPASDTAEKIVAMKAVNE
jgi:integrase